MFILCIYLRCIGKCQYLLHKAPRFYGGLFKAARMLLNQRRFLCLNFSLNTIKMCRAPEGFRFICVCVCAPFTCFAHIYYWENVYKDATEIYIRHIRVRKGSLWICTKSKALKMFCKARRMVLALNEQKAH